MTSINQPAVYVTVPIPLLPAPAPQGASPLPKGAHRNGTAQRKARAEPETTRLGSSSITDTPSRTPGQIAWSSYSKATLEAKQKYGKLLSNFCSYMEMCDNSGFAADGIAVGSSCKPYPPYSLEKGTGKNDFGKRHITGPLLNRWHPQRRTKWIAKMHTLAMWYEANKIDGCTLISLTGYQEHSGLSWYDTLDNITESRTKLLKILRKYFGKLDYFWVVEPHTQNDTGYPHIHLAVFKIVDNNIKDGYGEGMEDKLRRLYSEEWETGSHTYGLDFRPMKGEDDIKNLKNYLMKYIAKGYIGNEDWSTAELIFNAHLYGATHNNRPPKAGEEPDIKGNYSKKYRLIGMSQDLSKLLKPEEEDKEQIIWLHTDETEPTEIKQDDGTVITEEIRKPLYHRQLIPDWLDYLGTNRTDWGRPTGRYTGYDTIKKPEISERQRRKLEQDGYL